MRRAASACRPDAGPPTLTRPAAIGRIKVRADFLAARRGRRLNGPYFFIEALDRGDAAPPRFGITVTRKVGNAVVRNRIRRRLREAVRVHAGADMASGFDYVIVARVDLLDAPFEAIGRELSRRFSKTAEARERSGPANPDRER